MNSYTKQKFSDLINSAHLIKHEYVNDVNGNGVINVTYAINNSSSDDSSYQKGHYQYTPTPWTYEDNGLTPNYSPNYNPYVITTTPWIDPSKKPFIPNDEVELLKNEMNELKERINQSKDVPNKVDKDLANSKLPYNIKKDCYDNLIYEISCAGYSASQISVIANKEGFILNLRKRNDDDDLVGDEFVYLCQGLKENDQKAEFFIDWDEYNSSNYVCKLNHGILKIIIKKKKVNSVRAEIEDESIEQLI